MFFFCFNGAVFFMLAILSNPASLLLSLMFYFCIFRLADRHGALWHSCRHTWLHLPWGAPVSGWWWFLWPGMWLVVCGSLYLWVTGWWVSSCCIADIIWRGYVTYNMCFYRWNPLLRWVSCRNLREDNEPQELANLPRGCGNVSGCQRPHLCLSYRQVWAKMPLKSPTYFVLNLNFLTFRKPVPFHLIQAHNGLAVLGQQIKISQTGFIFFSLFWLNTTTFARFVLSVSLFPS